MSTGGGGKMLVDNPQAYLGWRTLLVSDSSLVQAGPSTGGSAELAAVSGWWSGIGAEAAVKAGRAAV